MEITEKGKEVLTQAEIDELTKLNEDIVKAETLLSAMIADVNSKYKKRENILKDVILRDEKNRAKINKERKEQNRLNKLKGKK